MTTITMKIAAAPIAQTNIVSKLMKSDFLRLLTGGGLGLAGKKQPVEAAAGQRHRLKHRLDILFRNGHIASYTHPPDISKLSYNRQKIKAAKKKANEFLHSPWLKNDAGSIAVVLGFVRSI